MKGDHYGNNLIWICATCTVPMIVSGLHPNNHRPCPNCQTPAPSYNEVKHDEDASVRTFTARYPVDASVD